MTKVLILSDIHCRHAQVDQILTWESWDKVIQTGDHFDGWGDTPELNGVAAQWVKAKLADPRFILLWGNHECPAAFPQSDQIWRPSDNADAKVAAIRGVLSDGDYDKLRPCYLEPTTGILFSHAGIDAYLPQVIASLGFQYPTDMTAAGLNAWINKVHPHVVARYRSGLAHPLFEQGMDRGGPQRVGGILWGDFNHHRPVNGIGQIVGHTIMDRNKGPLFRLIGHDKSPTWRIALRGIEPGWLSQGWTLCMDTCNRHYIMLDTNEMTLTVKSVKWSRQSEHSPYEVTPGDQSVTIDLSS